MEIVKKSFITLWSIFFGFGILVLIVSGGNNTLDLSKAFNDMAFELNNNNFYTIILKFILKDNYNNLSEFEKVFFLTSKCMEIPQALNGMINIPIIGPLISGFLNMLIFSLVAITFLAEFIINTIAFIFALCFTIFKQVGKSIPTLA